MNADVEELLTEQMHREADAAAWRPELLNGALRRRKIRRARGRVLIPAMAVGVAAAVVASVALADAGRVAPARIAPKVQTVAYVVNRAKSAITAADEDVLEVQTRAASGWSYTLWFEVRPVLQLRVDVANTSGWSEEVFADGFRITTLDFQNHTWWAVQLPSGARPKHAILMVPGEAMVPLMTVGSGLGGALALPTPQNLRRELADGKFRLAGQETIDGTRVLHLQGASPSDRSVNIWVNAASYLPVRSSELIRSQTGNRLGWLRLNSRLTWLPATVANLAQLRPGIPAGFKHQPPQCPCG